MGARVLALDAGTTGCKCAVVDDDGRVRARAERTYPLHTDPAGAAEQDPEQVVAAALEAAAEAVALAGGPTPDCVSLACAMHSLVAIDGDGEALTPLLTYADRRAVAQARRLAASDPELYRRTGTPVHPMSPLAKLAWLADADGVVDRAWLFADLKSLLLNRLCGRWVVDRSVASASGLYNLLSAGWDRAALELAGIGEDRLPLLVDTTDVVGGLGATAAEATGLREGTPVVAGAADGCAANLGCGAVEPGVVALSLGTSGAVRQVVDAPVLDENGRTFCYVLTRDRFVVGGAISNGGLVLSWLRSLFEPSGKDPHEELLRAAEASPPGADGLVFVPHLTGERTPVWDPGARGLLFGLGVHHRRSDVARAALEGVALAMRGALAALDELVPSRPALRSTGGFVRSRFVARLVADVLQRPLTPVREPDATALGGALIGMMAAGAVPSIEAAARLVELDAPIDPDPDLAGLYAALHGRYGRLEELARAEARRGST